MGIFLLIVAIIIFIVADLVIRTFLKKSQEKRLRKQREEALSVNLNLDFSFESKTLKRVDVENPKARILAVDDEEVILSSFRKILVLDGYSIDTVETGQEALGLIQKHHYDFVFTDLKMPEMDGVDVCKAVKHLRPDIDVIIITGYASVDTAVETMKYGAMDYVQKPFTEDELIAMVNKFLIRRQDRIKKQLKAKVHITHHPEAEARETVEFLIPGGVFISPGHCWLSISHSGDAAIGIDDFARKLIGDVDDIELPNLGMEVQKGQHLFSIRRGTHSIPFNSPITGKVSSVNRGLVDDIEAITVTPYEKNWICKIDAAHLDKELPTLKIGQSAVSFFEEDLSKLHKYIREVAEATGDDNLLPADGQLYIGQLEALKDKDYNAVVQDFFKR